MVLIAGLPGGMEWVILLVVALLLFGGSRLAGMGKGAGRAIREFKEETKGLKDGKAEKPEEIPPAPQSVQDPQTATQQAPVQQPDTRADN